LFPLLKPHFYFFPPYLIACSFGKSPEGVRLLELLDVVEDVVAVLATAIPLDVIKRLEVKNLKK
jgi:hypothetical protein